MERQTHGRTDSRTDADTDGQHSPLALLVGSPASLVLTGRWGYTSNTFITSARVTDGKCAYSSFVARSPPHLPLPCPALASRLPWPYVIRKGKRTNENFPIIADTARTRPQRKFNALNCPRSRAVCPLSRRVSPFFMQPVEMTHFRCERKSFVNALIYPKHI